MRALSVILTAVLCLLSAAIAYIRVAQAHYVVPVLMYHAVYPDASRTNRLAVSARTFERQMRFLRTRGYNVVPLQQIAEAIRAGRRVPAGTVAVTLDDGYLNNYRYALPILERYQIPATIFVIVDEVGRPRGDRLGWQHLARLVQGGLVTIGAHCMGPEPLINLDSADEVRRQIVQSKNELEQRLHVPVKAFSYPEGLFTPAIRQMVIDAGFETAVATNPGKRYPSNDVFALKRLRISENSGNLRAFWLQASGWYTFIKEQKRKK